MVKYMAQYKYVTILEAQNDGQPPNDNIEAGDKTVKPGKHETDELTYMADASQGRDLLTIEWEAVAVYESDERMTEAEAIELAKEEWFDDDD